MLRTLLLIMPGDKGANLLPPGIVITPTRHHLTGDIPKKHPQKQETMSPRVENAPPPQGGPTPPEPVAVTNTIRLVVENGNVQVQ